MKNPAPADLQRWSEELARNPASLAFLPLARAYRRIGRRDHALRLTLRGLEAHPGNVEAHALLALLHLEEGDRARAADEWSIVLRLKPGNFEALRGMGFRYLEQNDIPNARQHLERAALIRPDDTAVAEALRLIRQREAAAPSRPPAPAEAAVEEVVLVDEVEGVEEAELLELDVVVEPAPAADAPAAGWTPYDAPRAETRTHPEPAPPPASPAPAVPARVQPAAPPPANAPVAAASLEDPARLFDDLLASPNVLGALLLDARGLVLAGALQGGASPDDAGAVLGGAVDEAVRTIEFLGLGGWRSLLLECGSAALHVRPIADQGIAVLAVTPDAPTGWILRTAASLATRAAGYLEVPA